MSQDLAACRAALKQHCSDLMSRKNVVATGIGYKVTGNQQTETLSIICSVTRKGGVSDADMVPQSVDGVPTDVIETGVIEAQVDRQGRNRPAPGGVSLGHVDITAGTLGCLVQKNGETFILSNNHVIANSNDAQIGDPIIQPGNADGGSHPQDQIATLEDFVTIDFGGGGDGGGGGQPPPFPPPGGCGGFNMFAVAANGGHPGAQMTNTVDAAIARPIDSGAVENTIFEIGTIAGQASATLGMGLKKSGRTTGLTTGTVNQVDVTVNVSYGNAGTAQFTNQLIAGAMSQGGDSGSAVLNDNNEIVGLLFAGSSTTTVINRIEDVFSALGVTL